ncbi:MAG: hypothetical protein ABIT37_07195 [Luteolibacter sp.]
MKPARYPTAVRAGAVIGFLATAALGWKLAGQPPPPAVSREEKATKSQKRPTRAVRRSDPPTAAQQRMAGIRAITSPVERMRATIEMANTMPVSEIEAWLEGRWFDTGGGFDLSLFNKILKERWSREDPEGLVLWNMKNGGNANAILAEWAKNEPQRVIDFFKAHPNPQLQIDTLTALVKTNPSLALQGLQEMAATGSALGNQTEYYIDSLLQELTKSSPAALEAVLDSLPPAMKLKAESALIGQKLSVSFNKEFQKLLDRPDGLKIFQNLRGVKGLGDKLLENLATLPPAWRTSLASNFYNLIDDSNSKKWFSTDLAAAGFTPEEMKNIRSYALSRLGNRQPEEALKLMAGSSLGAEEKESVLGNIFGRLSDEPEKAAKLLALLTSPEDRQAAQKTIDSNGGNTRITQVEKPREWLEKVSSFTSRESIYLNPYLSMIKGWDQEKITELTTQFRAMPDDKKQQIAQVIAQAQVGNREVSNPTLQGEAIRYLLTNPVAPAEGKETNRTENPVRQTSQFAVGWAKSDPTAASAWVQTLPSGDAKLWAQKNLAANWNQYDPQATEQWLKTLSASERTEVQKFIKSGGNN